MIGYIEGVNLMPKENKLTNKQEKVYKRLEGSGNWIETFYKRDGTPYPPGEVGLHAWGRDCANMKLKRVAKTVLKNGNIISTVWLGLNQNFGAKRHQKPIIFETMIFPSDKNFSEFDCERYSTEAEAIKGHNKMVKKWAAKIK